MLLLSLLLAYIVAFGIVHSEICELSDNLNSCYKKFLSFEAIGHIHKYLDNDKNGEVDSSEAAKFVREEFSTTEQARKSNLLTMEDPLVSLPDLWLMWKRNPAFSWSVQQTVRWLSDNVNLPQYGDIFMKHSVDGKSLPLLALQNMSYLTNVLLIQNPIDKRKIMLKALDTILFGPPQGAHVIYTKTSVITASCGLVMILALLYTQLASHYLPVNNRSSTSDSSSGTEHGLKQLQLRLDDLEQLRHMLNSWEASPSAKWPVSATTKQLGDNGDQCSDDRPIKQLVASSEDTFPLPKLTDKVNDNLCSDGDLSDYGPGDSPIPMNMTESDLHCSATRAVTTGSNLHGTNELALWLQITYELEMQHHRERRAEAEAQLNAARHACKRLNRKRYNILGSVRLLHTDSLDELEFRLMNSKHVLEQLQAELEERVTRWNRIESLTGFQIRSNPGLSHLLTLTNPCAQFISENSSCTVPFRAFGRIPIDGLSSQSASDVPHVITDELGPCTDSVECVRGSRSNITSRSSAEATKSEGLPRNYSFVRPFASLWRKKAKSRCSTSVRK